MTPLARPEFGGTATSESANIPEHNDA